MMEEVNQYILDEKKNKPNHIPGYNYCGPGTKVVTSLVNNIRPINDLDEGCRYHDVEYLEFAGDADGIQKSDEKLVNVAKKWRKSKKFDKQTFSSKIFNWFTSHLVEKIFRGKRFLEKLKIIDPIQFTYNLSKKPINSDRRVGKFLKQNYFD